MNATSDSQAVDQSSTPVVHKLRNAAARLDMSLRSLERHIAMGRVRTIRIGRSVRIPESEIQRLLRGE